jgi:hypothetical protein
MSRRVCSFEAAPRLLPILALLVLVILPLVACSTPGDFGRLAQPVVNDDVHAWVGQEAAAHQGAPVSLNNLTDDERTLRDLAFPLIEPPYDRQRWDQFVYEYGLKRPFRHELWAFNPAVYYANLMGEVHRSTASRYNKLIDDMRNDIVRLEPFFEVARRVSDIDQRREKSIQYVADLSPTERASALARVGENSLTIIWVQHSLTQRCASYRYALNHLTVAEPEPTAADAERILNELQQQIAAHEIVPAADVAAAPAQIVDK